MGLFDDLLKKPTADTSSGSDPSSTQGGNPPVVDPLAQINPPPAIKIEKTEEVSIVTESPANSASEIPPVITPGLSEDNISSIIIDTHSTPAQEGINIDKLSPMTENLPATGLSGASQQPLKSVQEVDVTPIIAEEGPLDSILNDTSSPTDTMSVSSDDRTTLDSSIITQDASYSLIDTLGSSPLMNQSQDQNIGGLEYSEVMSTGISDILTPSLDDGAVSAYEHPSEFITASIARIDAMIARIDLSHNAELAEALSYKTEKEKYTALEDEAYKKAELYITEKEHAMTMRAYFVEQGQILTQQISDAPQKDPQLSSSVETTLTGLAVQSVVSKTVVEKSIDSNNISHEKNQQEEVGILGL